MHSYFNYWEQLSYPISQIRSTFLRNYRFLQIFVVGSDIHVVRRIPTYPPPLLDERPNIDDLFSTAAFHVAPQLLPSWMNDLLTWLPPVYTPSDDPFIEPTISMFGLYSIYTSGSQWIGALGCEISLDEVLAAFSDLLTELPGSYPVLFTKTYRVLLAPQQTYSFLFCPEHIDVCNGTTFSQEYMYGPSLSMTDTPVAADLLV